MSQCSQNPAMKIALIRKNLPQVKVEKEANTSAPVGEDKKAFVIVLPESEMTNVLEDITEIRGNRGNNNDNMPMEGANEIDMIDITPISDGQYNPSDIFENAPSFKIPANPLVPPEYNEISNYNDIQYANGFLRTQIGRFIKVDCLIGSDTIVARYGYLIGVGLNYILLQEASTGNITVVDFWSIKFTYIYYDKDDLKRVMPFAEEK